MVQQILAFIISPAMMLMRFVSVSLQLFTLLLLSWTPPMCLLLEILVFLDFCVKYPYVLFPFKRGALVSTSLCVSKYVYQNVNNSGESLIHLYSHVPLHQLVKMLSQAGLCSFRHSVILRHCSAAKRHLD